MVIPDFSFTRTPKILFGPGMFKTLPEQIVMLGKSIVLVTGASSLKKTYQWVWLIKTLEELNISWIDVSVAEEPSPDLVNQTVKKCSSQNIDIVMAIGGGSVIDAGKAISAMLPLQTPIQDYLEGVGTGQKHPDIKIPFIAVPTTAGTGTEATKNASLRKVGENGFKNSLRHDNLVPDIALIDPELSVSCSPRITAFCGMDAFAQLLESYVSTKATPLTDALALSGLEAIRDNLIPAFQDGSNLAARTGMAYAALVSGITLANAGLGIVHSLSSVIGGYHNIPHGVICGTLLGPGTRINIEKLKLQGKAGNPALNKHAKVGGLLVRRPLTTVYEGCEWLVHQIEEWTQILKIPRLSDFGLKAENIEKIVSKTTNRNNPVQLEKEDIQKILLYNLGEN